MICVKALPTKKEQDGWPSLSRFSLLVFVYVVSQMPFVSCARSTSSNANQGESAIIIFAVTGTHYVGQRRGTQILLDIY